MVKRAPRRTGTGAAKATASLPTIGEACDEEQPVTTTVGFIPDDPEDPRLTLEGLVLGGDGKVDLVAYEDLLKSFAGEPSPDQHPDPQHPGLRLGERIPKGMRIWDDLRAGATDKNGAGWVAVRNASQHEKKSEKWFNIRQCGSWRMAFLLARLQKAYWTERSEWLKAPVTPPKDQVSAVEDAKTQGNVGGASERIDAPGDSKPESTPKQKRSRPPAEDDASQKKAKTQKAKPIVQKPEQTPQKTPLISADVVAGSARLQQILAARAAAGAAAATTAA